ncbi:MAG: sigma-54-dependent Fis family transcriptional regulator [Sandaracinaceae bacterium]|nr:sigma-54-dependent Fis family transcriptional regulator [Sandaracinaceae bacterium]
MSEDKLPAHVLVVDDEEDLCELLAMRLEHHGYAVTTETSMRGAFELLTRELFDVVVLDLRLEDGDGMELLDRMREQDPDLPIVMLTAHGSIEAAVEAMQRGAYGFLTKPFHDHELLQKLEHALEGSQLRRELASFRRMVGDASSDQRLTGVSAAIAEVRELLTRIAPSEATVLITGESGTGKELAARTIHALSPRRDGPFVAVNCAALPAALLESELFGYVRGAFTGADRDKDGLLTVAGGGTVFLDEIGDAPAPVQAKLLRVLQERRFTRLGAVQELGCDVRVVAATNRDLRQDVASGRFREDLFYRLHVVPVRMPSLRERPEDIATLADLFLRRAAQQTGLPRLQLHAGAARLLHDYAWPGNVRELANLMTGAALLARDGRVGIDEMVSLLPALAQAQRRDEEHLAVSTLAPAQFMGVETGDLVPMRQARDNFDRAYLREALRRAQGNVSAAARLAERNRTDFHDLLRRHGIDANDFREG